MAQRRDPATLLQDPARLMRWRVEAHLSRPQLAAKAGVTRAYIWQLEKCMTSASVPSLGAIADALGCKITDLMRDGALDGGGGGNAGAA